MKRYRTHHESSTYIIKFLYRFTTLGPLVSARRWGHKLSDSCPTLVYNFLKVCKIRIFKGSPVNVFPAVRLLEKIFIPPNGPLSLFPVFYYFCDSRNIIEIPRCLLFFSTILRTILNTDICSVVTISVRIKFLKLPTFQFSCDGTSEW